MKPKKKPAKKKVKAKVRIEETYDEGRIQYDEFREALIGVGERAGGLKINIYDKQVVLDILMRYMDEDDAVEHYYYNVLGSYLGDSTPIFLDREIDPDELDD